MRLFGWRPPDDVFEFFPTSPRWSWPVDGDPKWIAVGRKAAARAAVFSIRAWRFVRPPFRWSAAYLRFHATPITALVSAGVLIAALGLIGYLGYQMWRVPSWVLAGSTTQAEVVARITVYRTTQSGVIGLIIQSVGGLAVLIGIAFARQQLLASQEAAITERLGRSMDQLASDRVAIRVGAIETLERLSQDRPGEFATILRLLTVFVIEQVKFSKNDGRADALVTIPLDAQMALSALQRFQAQRLLRGPNHSVSLSGADFSRMRMQGIDLSGFDLSEVNFEGADLSQANLRNTSLRSSILRNAVLDGATLTGVDLVDVDAAGARCRRAVLRSILMSHVSFRGADLSDADCEWSDFTHADFNQANLTGTRFYGTKLLLAHLEGQDLRVTKGLDDRTAGFAKTDSMTILPGKTPEQATAEWSGYLMGGTRLDRT